MLCPWLLAVQVLSPPCSGWQAHQRPEIRGVSEVITLQLFLEVSINGGTLDTDGDTDHKTVNDSCTPLTQLLVTFGTVKPLESRWPQMEGKLNQVAWDWACTSLLRFTFPTFSFDLAFPVSQVLAIFR